MSQLARLWSRSVVERQNGERKGACPNLAGRTWKTFTKICIINWQEFLKTYTLLCLGSFSYSPLETQCCQNCFGSILKQFVLFLRSCGLCEEKYDYWASTSQRIWYVLLKRSVMRIIVLPVWRCRFLEENGNGLRLRRNKIWQFTECTTPYNRPSCLGNFSYSPLKTECCQNCFGTILTKDRPPIQQTAVNK